MRCLENIFSFNMELLKWDYIALTEGNLLEWTILHISFHHILLFNLNISMLKLKIFSKQEFSFFLYTYQNKSLRSVILTKERYEELQVKWFCIQTIFLVAKVDERNRKPVSFFHSVWSITGLITSLIGNFLILKRASVSTVVSHERLSVSILLPRFARKTRGEHLFRPFLSRFLADKKQWRLFKTCLWQVSIDVLISRPLIQCQWGWGASWRCNCMHPHSFANVLN